MRLRFFRHTLQLRNAFTIAANSRLTTPAMIVSIEHEGITGYGEASMPPYLGETFASAELFFRTLNLERFSDPFLTADILATINERAPGNTAAKAAIDIALHDWQGKSIGLPWYRIWGLDPKKIPPTSFTIGMDTCDNIRKKTAQASAYAVLKIKLGRETDRAIIEAIREVTNAPIRVDVNQGWADKYHALKMIEWLAQRNVQLVEQPLAADKIDDCAWLREKSPLPIIADEAVQRLADLPGLRGVYDGVNIKLMKCTGMREAYRMMEQSRALGLGVMLGCMTETSCAISAATQLAPLADWVDLDGALLISNDLFNGATCVEGRMIPRMLPGIGALPIDPQFMT